MGLEIRRIILFVSDVPTVMAFYRDVLELPVVGTTDEPDWCEFAAGGCTIALHGGGGPTQRRRAPKIVFRVDDVGAERQRLNARGAQIGAVKAFGDVRFCDGEDPEGNVFQLSNRR